MSCKSISDSISWGAFYSTGIVIGAFSASVASKANVLNTFKGSLSVASICGVSTGLSIYTLSETDFTNLKVTKVVSRVAFIFFSTMLLSPKLSNSISNCRVTCIQAAFLMMNGLGVCFILGACFSLAVLEVFSGAKLISKIEEAVEKIWDENFPEN